MRVAVTGASGMIGGALVQSLRADGADVITIGRSAGAAVQWNPARGELDPHALSGAHAVVHLAGSPIAVRWTDARKREIRESRVVSTELLARAFASMPTPPRVFVCGSAVGVYGDRGDTLLTELSTPGEGFLAGVVRDWETAAGLARESGTRVVSGRTGIALSPKGGALGKLLTPFRLGVGGPAGDGKQWMSWIGLHDLVRAIRFCIDTDIDGPVNLVAPNPVTNCDFSRVLGAVLSRPAAVHVPAFALRALFGDMANETILASQRAVPQRLVTAGFTFSTPELSQALHREL